MGSGIVLIGPQTAQVKEVYDLLKQVDFPHLPDAGQAQNLLQKCRNIGWYDGDKLAVWVGIHSGEKNKDNMIEEVSLDIAVRPEYRKRWAMKGMVRGVLGGLFEYGIKRIKVDCRNGAIAKMAQKVGFKMRDDQESHDVSNHLHTNWYRLVLTREAYLGKFS